MKYSFRTSVLVDRFFNKTCSFRDAPPLLYNYRGIFFHHPSQADHGLTTCRMGSCRLCYPNTEIMIGARQEQRVVPFSSAQTHRFIKGYEAILYALTCPCRQLDYVRYTSLRVNVLRNQEGTILQSKDEIKQRCKYLLKG